MDNETDGVKYPNITVNLLGEDGNAFMVLGLVRRALKNANVPQDKIDEFFKEATTGDYNELLQVVMKWVNVE